MIFLKSKKNEMQMRVTLNKPHLKWKKNIRNHHNQTNQRLDQVIEFSYFSAERH